MGREDDKSGGVIKHVLIRLKASLTKEKWKDHPAEKQAMVWCVRQLNHPHLSAHLDSLLPATLLLLDDHDEYHKVLGLTTATHIIKNVVRIRSMTDGTFKQVVKLSSIRIPLSFAGMAVQKYCMK